MHHTVIAVAIAVATSRPSSAAGGTSGSIAFTTPTGRKSGVAVDARVGIGLGRGGGVPVVGLDALAREALQVQSRLRKGVETLNELSRGLKLGAQIARWAMGRPNILATSPSHVHVFWKSFPELDEPDLQCVFTPGSYAEGKVYVLDEVHMLSTQAFNALLKTLAPDIGYEIV